MMKTLAAFGLMTVASQAALTDLWNPAKTCQVQVPCVLAAASEADTYKCAGWWFGYIDLIGSFAPVYAEDYVLDGKVANAKGSLKVNNQKDGSPWADGAWSKTNGLTVQLTAGAGTDEAPSIGAFAFNWAATVGGVIPTVDISAHKGICLTYTSDIEWTMELGWNEATYKYDNWFATLPAAAKKTVALNWDLTVSSDATKSGAFGKKGYAEDDLNQPIQTAVTKSEAIKFSMKNFESTPKAGSITVHSLGWTDDGVCGSSIAVLPTVSASGMKSVLAGRSLSFSGMGKTSVSVDVINFQGQVVSHGVVSAAKSSLNLAALSSGVYMVRATGEGLNLTQKIMLK